MSDVMTKLQTIVRECFVDDSLEVNRETVASDIEGCDSLSYVRLLLLVEAEFKVRFNYAERSKLEKFGEMEDLILGKLG